MVKSLQAFKEKAGQQEERSLKVFVVAGETSGDEHAAQVVKALKDRHSSIEFLGMGGRHLRAAGVHTVVNSEVSASVMGFTEVIGSLGKIKKAFDALLAAAEKEQPDLIILVDYAEFNMLLARRLKKKGFKILYFITPQLWAWRQGRVKKIKKYIDQVAVIFPFEESFFLRHGVNAEFVGHPFTGNVVEQSRKSEFLSCAGLSAEKPIVALLPGSRKKEVEQLIRPMVAAVRRLQMVRPGVQAVIPVAPNIDEAWLRERMDAEAKVTLVSGQARELLSVATVAVVASGTATVETALARVPFFVVYRVSSLTFRLAKLLVRGVKYIAMPNLIAGEEVVKELLQEDVSEGKIFLELERLLGDPGRMAALSQKLEVVAQKLRSSQGGEVSSAAERTAALALEMLR